MIQRQRKQDALVTVVSEIKVVFDVQNGPPFLAGPVAAHSSAALIAGTRSLLAMIKLASLTALLCALSIGFAPAPPGVQAFQGNGAALSGTLTDLPDGATSPLVVLSTAKWLLEGTRPTRENHDKLVTWTSAVGADGAFAIADLPTKVILKAEVKQGEEVLWASRQPLSLEPREARHVQWRVGTKAAVSFQVRDEQGQAIAGTSIGLYLPQAASAGRLIPGSARRSSKITDAQGRVTFPAVFPGDWVVGPEMMRPRPDKPQATGAYAPVAQALRVGYDGSPMEQELVLPEGLTIEGYALGPDGKPAGRLSIAAVQEGDSIPVYAFAEPTGRFVLGPLFPGSYWLNSGMSTRGPGAAQEPSTHRPSKVIQVAPGERDVELRLRAGGLVRLRVVDAATGEPATGAVYSRSGADEEIRAWPIGADGTAIAGELEPGKRDLVCVADGARIGTALSVPVAPGESLGPIEVKVYPAGQVRVVADSCGPATLTVEVGDTVYGGKSIYPGQASLVTVPLGTVHLKLVGATSSHASGPCKHSKTIEILPGEIAEVRFDNKDH